MMSMDRITQIYDWIELEYRPKKDGLHDSGYRFLKLTGAKMSPKRDGTVYREDLHQWSDHVMFQGPSNIDVTPDGTIRIMPGIGPSMQWVCYDTPVFFSSATFHAVNMAAAVKRLELEQEIIEKIYGDVTPVDELSELAPD
jgi:hypothetical protein